MTICPKVVYYLPMSKKELTHHILTNLYHKGKPCILASFLDRMSKSVSGEERLMKREFSVFYGTHYGVASLDEIERGEEVILCQAVAFSPQKTWLKN